jgi:hypothetical protein
MHRKRSIAFTFAFVFVLISLKMVAETVGAWQVQLPKRRVVSHPARVSKASDAGLYVACVAGVPSVSIQVRDPVSAAPTVKLQFGGHQGTRISFVGTDGVVREFKGFSRGTTNRLVAVANSQQSAEIVAELLRGHSRLAWMVDTEDGFDSLEVPTTDFALVWGKLECGPETRR